jgi:hypothetical protein
VGQGKSSLDAYYSAFNGAGTNGAVLGNIAAASPKVPTSATSAVAPKTAATGSGSVMSNAQYQALYQQAISKVSAANAPATAAAKAVTPTGSDGYATNAAGQKYIPYASTTMPTKTLAANAGANQSAHTDANVEDAYSPSEALAISNMADGFGYSTDPAIADKVEQSQESSWGKDFMLADELVLAGATGGATAAAVGGALGGGVAGAVVGGAAGGAAGATTHSVLSGAGAPTGKALLTGAVTGGIGGGLTYGLGANGLNASQTLQDNGLSGTVANALVKGGVSAVTGGLTGAITGGSSQKVGSSPNGSQYILGGAAASGAGSLLGGGQGNNGNMADSTDTSLAGTFASALPGLGGLLQAGATSAGSLAGANAQSNADQNAITTQKSTLGNINSVWGTQQSLGQGADTALGSALGTNGQPANYSGFENMPGYAFAQQQGTQAIQRQAASMGSAYTPNTAAAVGQYVTGTAMQDYNTYISQLMGAAGLGTTANQGLQTANQQYGNNVGQLQQNIGQAQAAGYSGVGSAAAGLFSPNGAGTSLLGAAGSYLGGGGGGGGGYSGSGVGGGTDGSAGGGYGGSIETAAPGQQLTYDADGNITGSTASSAGDFGSIYDDAGSDLGDDSDILEDW